MRSSPKGFIRLISGLLTVVLLVFSPLFARNTHVPAGARILFEDAFQQPEWKGAKAVDGAGFGLSGRVLVPVGFADTVRFEREAGFTLEEENFINFQFTCAGYQRLRLLAWTDSQQNPKSVMITHFSPGEPCNVDIPVEGNFHNYHWRAGDYSSLKPGDRIQRLALEFSLAEKIPARLAVGRITVYSLTGQVHRQRYESALEQARSAIEKIPESLKNSRERFETRLEEIAGVSLSLPADRQQRLKEFTGRLAAVTDAAGRMADYYETAARSAPNLEKLDYCVGAESSLRRVTHLNPRLRFRGQVPAEPEIGLAANEHEAFQLVILPFDCFLRDVRVSVSDLACGAGRIDRSNITVGRLLPVRTQLSPHSNGEDLGWVPDVIAPLEDGDSFDIPPEGEIPLWISVYAPAGTPAGTYSGKLTVEPRNSHATTVLVQVTVWDFEIPRRGMFRTQGHFSIEHVENFYNRKMDTGWLKDWYSFWLDYRFDPVGQYSSYLTPEPELIPFCLERGLKTINLGGFSGAGEVDRAALDSVYSFITDNGWLDYSYVYIGDETSNFELMRTKADVIHTRYPGVKVMIGGSIPRPELIGYIDVWDPIMRPGGVYGFTEQSCRQALARGEEVLWYVCIAPHPPYPNVQMEDPLVDSRSLFWMTYKYDIMGYEYWGYTFWEKNIMPAGNPRWPDIEWNSYAYDHTNGDGQLCYPGPGGLPWASVRLAANRDGIEDWEALWLAEDLARTACELGLDRNEKMAGLVRRARELADIPDAVVRDLTHYTKDSGTILTHRDQVSSLIVALQREIGRERAAQYRERHIRERRELERKSLERNIARAKRDMK